MCKSNIYFSNILLLMSFIEYIVLNIYINVLDINFCDQILEDLLFKISFCCAFKILEWQLLL